MENSQAGILLDPPKHARFLTFTFVSGSDLKAALTTLKEIVNGETVVAGIGQPFLNKMNIQIPGMKAFTHNTGPVFYVPLSASALWLWLRGDDRGELLHLSRFIEKELRNYFKLETLVDSFQYKDSRDLTGYEDGTENPKGDEAIKAAIVSQESMGLDGSSFVAVQQWIHDLDTFDAMSQIDQDNSIGRRRTTNEELSDAPESAHIKRVEQEDFDPPAFILRRSMPWTNGQKAGLMFVAFGHSFDAFETLLNHMTGKTDNTIDALFKFTKPINAGYFWCPPMLEKQLDLRLLGIE